MRRSRSVVIAVLSSRAILQPLFLTRRLFVDESSEGELGFRGAFIFAILVALLHVCKQSSDRALARRVLSGFEYLRKAFKKLSVPHTRSIQAQILNPESLTPSIVSLVPASTLRKNPRLPCLLERQLSFLILLHDFVKGNDNIQFIIATHSPLLLAHRFFLSLRKKFTQLTTVKASLFNWSADSSQLLRVI